MRTAHQYFTSHYRDQLEEVTEKVTPPNLDEDSNEKCDEPLQGCCGGGYGQELLIIIFNPQNRDEVLNNDKELQDTRKGATGNKRGP